MAAPTTLTENWLGVFRVRTGAMAFEIAHPHQAASGHPIAAFSPDGSLLFTMDKDLAAWRLEER